MPESLSDLEQRREVIAERIARLGDLRPGSITSTSGRCGKPDCRCHQPGQPGHGPNFRLTYKVNGKTVNIKLSKQAAPLYQAATKQHRKLKAVLAKMERCSQTALAHLAKQAEKTD